MIRPFYGSNTIDDSAKGCETVIVSDCAGNHHYANVCSLIQNCLPPQQLTSPCVVNFLNTLDAQPVGHYLRVSASHCLEAVPAPVNDTDYRVKVDSIDTSGYLEDKIKSCGNIAVSTKGPAGARYIELCAQNTGTFLGLTDVPDTIYQGCVSLETSNSFVASHIVVNNTHTGLSTYCETKPIGRVFLSSNVSINKTNLAALPYGSSVTDRHGFIGNLTKYQCDAGMNQLLPVNPSGMHTIDGSGNVPSLKITESGIRRISFKGNAKINMGVQAFRIYVTSNLSKLVGCVDSKFGAGPNPQVPMVFSYNLKATNSGEPVVSHFNFGGDTEMYISDADISSAGPNGVLVTLAFAIDTAAGTGEDPEVTIFASGLGGGTYDNTLASMGNQSGLSLGIEFLRKKNYDIPF